MTALPTQISLVICSPKNLPHIHWLGTFHGLLSIISCIRVKAFGLALGLQGHWEEVDSVV